MVQLQAKAGGKADGASTRGEALGAGVTELPLELSTLALHSDGRAFKVSILPTTSDLLVTAYHLPPTTYYSLLPRP